MSKFCDQCSTPIGFFSRKRVTLPDGTQRVLCRACAAEPVVAATDASPPPSPVPTAPTANYREAAPVPLDQEPGVSDEHQLEYLESALRDDPRSEAVLRLLGHLSLRMAQRSKDDERASHLKRAGSSFRSLLLVQGAGTAPSSKAETLIGLATTCELEGDHAKAKVLATRALDVDDSHEPARTMLARLD